MLTGRGAYFSFKSIPVIKDTKLKCHLGKSTVKIKLRPYVSRSKLPNFDAANTVCF